MDVELKSLIEKDCYRYFGEEKRPLFYKRRIFTLKYIIAFRKASYYANKNLILGFYYKWKLRNIERRCDIDIPIGTKIGDGFYIAHKGTIVIYGSDSLGKNIYISANATIGLQSRGKKYGAPIIGDNVWIGANSVIVGKVKIGSNVLIAPNTYINFDVPDNSIVLGSPGNIIPRENAVEGYILNKV